MLWFLKLYVYFVLITPIVKPAVILSPELSFSTLSLVNTTTYSRSCKFPSHIIIILHVGLYAVTTSNLTWSKGFIIDYYIKQNYERYLNLFTTSKTLNKIYNYDLFIWADKSLILLNLNEIYTIVSKFNYTVRMQYIPIIRQRNIKPHSPTWFMSLFLQEVQFRKQ